MTVYDGVKTIIELAVPICTGRVFPITAPEGFKLPYILYHQIYERNLKCLDGYSGNVSFDFQINLYASTYMEVRNNSYMFSEYFKIYRNILGTKMVQDTEELDEHDDKDFVGSKVRYIVMKDIRFFCVNK